MKKLLTCIVAVLFVLPGFAQHSLNNRQFLHPNHQNLTPAGTTQFNANQHSQQQKLLALMQKLDNITSQEYDVDLSQWVNSSIIECTYNTRGDNTTDIYSNWNPETELYEPSSKQELSFTDGRPTEMVFFEWVASPASWEPALKSVYSYDGAGNMVLTYDYYYNSPDWILLRKEENTFNGAGNLTLKIVSMWDESGNTWINMNKEERAYNGSGYLTNSTTFLWNLALQVWIYSNMDEYLYNGNGQLITDNFFSWDEVSEIWMKETQNDYTYGDDMNLVLSIEMEWGGDHWVNTSKTEISYNNAYTFDQLLLPFSYMGNDSQLMFTHMPVEFVESDYVGTSYVLSDRTLFKFSEMNITDVMTIEPVQVSLYPQPADDYVNFGWETGNPTFDVDIYNIDGKLVLEKKVNNSEAVAIDNLAAGLYIYRLAINGQHSLSGKLSVR